MHEKKIDTRFWAIVENEAANDIWLRGLTEYLILGKTELVPPEFLENFDMLDMQNFFSEYYGLDQDGIERAFTACELEVLGTWADSLGVTNGQT